MKIPRIIAHVPVDLGLSIEDVQETIAEFVQTCRPIENGRLHIFVDVKTKAWYCECQVRAKSLVEQGTIDVPLDPEDQSEYRANRDVVEDHVAYEKMQEDALAHRTFSNIVAEFNTEFDSDKPLKIIGGQHRFNAIEKALKQDVNELHGIKIYFDLDPDQRLDVQLISNTNIAASTDLFDRMQETLLGPELRDWCQRVGLLEKKKDFADKRQMGKPITVRAARTFIINYYCGRETDPKSWDNIETQPSVCISGEADPEWQRIRAANPGMWKDAELEKAAKAFVALANAQRAAFPGKGSTDSKEKAFNFAVLSAWSFVAGILESNPVRLKRHFDLSNPKTKDPLSAAALAKGRHKTDPDNYRGLGYRHDAKERGRFAELFFLQGEKGMGITQPLVDLAIKKYHAKQAVLDVAKAEKAS